MNKLESLRCVETTSQRQADNGTICYHDPITGADYLSYESGYIRRSYIAKSWRTGKDFRTIYQLNSTRKGVATWRDRTYEVVERVMIQDPYERLDRLAKAVSNYRISVRKEQERIEAYRLSQQK